MIRRFKNVMKLPTNKILNLLGSAMFAFFK